MRSNKTLHLYCSHITTLLRLKNISLFQFRTYPESNFSFTEKIIAICGNNGIGKTNLLDAIYYLSFTKSYFSKSDIQNVRHGCMGFRLEGKFEKGQSGRPGCLCFEGDGEKGVSVNEETYEKFSAHIGRFPCVMVTPDDVEIIAGGSEGRRRFMDTLFCQLNEEYLQQLIEYNKILQQRNGFLKSLGDKKNVNYSLLDVYDHRMAKPGAIIFEKRKDYLRELLPLVKKIYTEISGQEDNIALSYNSQLFEGALEKIVKNFRERDILLQRTNGGLHKDDIEITLNGQLFKTTASQGQRKSLLFAMKLAEFELLKEEKKYAPILLLDDVFEKLDEGRMYNLLDRVCLLNEGQIFITDTHSERICKHFEKLSVGFQLISL